jgi:DNA-binding NtrC family response regulator
VVTETPNSPASARILVVDDERALLPLLERYLKKLGYAPVCLPDPLSGLEAFRASEEAFDLVMTDLTLEGMSGEELAKVVLEESLTARVVIMSGYPYTTENFAEELRGRVTFLQKPFLPQQFLDAVARFTPVVAPVENSDAGEVELAVSAADEVSETVAPVEEQPVAEVLAGTGERPERDRCPEGQA